MTLKQELQKLNDRLDKCRHKLAAAEQRKEQQTIIQLNNDIEKITSKITHLKSQKTQQASSKAKDVRALPFSRAITKAEQADMGKLKKSVRGLVVVHPLTALGREMGLDVVTGFARSKF